MRTHALRNGERGKIALSDASPGVDGGGVTRQALNRGWQPGGSIMIHGLPNDPRHTPDYYASQDWTDGCIAVTNADMVEIWMMTSDNVPIDIEP